MQFTKNDTNAIKGIAILMMMFHHCFLDEGRYAGYDIDFGLLGEYLTVYLSQFCKICVSIFVFISGYGITCSLKKTEGNNCSSQIRNRYLSLMSGFWFIYILSFISALILDRSILDCYNGNYPADYPFFVICDFMGVSELFGTPTMIGTWWYMSLAVLIVAIMPLMYCIYKKFGGIAATVSLFFITNVFDPENSNMTRWLLTLFLGMIFAENDLLVKIKSFTLIKKNKALDYTVKLISGGVISVFCIYLRQNIDWSISYLRDGIIPVVIIIYSYMVITDIPILKDVLRYIGKHSMNIFLAHTFLRAFYLKDFIYSFKYPWLIVAVLTAVSLLLSVVIEALKKYSGYNKLILKIKAGRKTAT